MVRVVMADSMDANGFSTGQALSGTISVGDSNTPVSGSGGVTDGSGVDAQATELDREKTIHDMNEFIIESYKLRMDKILSDLNDNIKRFPPDTQVRILRQVSLSVNEKLKLLESRDVSPNRKEILTAILTYIETRIDESVNRINRER